MKKTFAFAVLSALSAFVLTGHAANRPPLGGGTTKAGLLGEYFANGDFEGEPAFARRDVRINHDWKEGPAGSGLPVGGATTPGMKDFPTDDFSIRWTGQVVARFSEDYTFRVTGKDGVRFVLGGKLLVDSLGRGVVKDVVVPMKSGKKVDVVFEYVDRAGTGASEARLEWSSPSTPLEVVDPLSFAQIDGHQAAPQTWLTRERADIKRETVSWRGLGEKGWKGGKKLTGDELDVDGWPTVGDSFVELHFQVPGRHRVIFTGKANVEVGSYWHGARPPVEWNAAADGSGQSFSTENSRGSHGLPLLPKGTGYDPRTNTTQAWFDIAEPPSGLMLLFTDAERTPGKPGITALKVLSPISAGSDRPHEPGEILKRQARTVFQNFIINRLHIGMSLNPGWTWDQRTLPSYHAREHEHGWGYCLEEYIMRINESGMDWHICCGAGWDQEYMKKLAQMVRYGSDGVNPYEDYVENPKYPPLNPNLRIYLEHSNELPWAVYPRWVWDDLRKKFAEKHPDIKIINYDGQCKGADGRAMFRYHALRMTQISRAFREVYADVPGAMPERFRPLCFGQYDAGHMNNMLQFMSNYFGKADPKSTYEGEPHPPSYYIWGGGGAIYYGCSNKFGLMETEPIANGGFEKMDVPNGVARLRPDGGGWRFTGNAGICDVRLPRREAVNVDAMPAEPAPVPAKDQWVGLKFTVGEKDLFVYQLGRWMPKDHTESNFWRSRVFRMSILDEKGGQVAGFRSSPRLATFEGDTFGYEWCAERAWGKSKPIPAYLQAGRTYYLVSREDGGDEANRFFGPVEVTATAGIKIEAAVAGTNGKNWDETAGSLSYGPVNMILTDEVLQSQEGVVGVPPDASEAVFVVPWGKDARKGAFEFGTQCAFLQGDSTMSREFTVEKPGAYWVTFNPCLDRLSNGYRQQSWGGWTVSRGIGTIRVKVDGENVTIGKLLPGGGYESRGKVFHYAATNVFKLEPGQHTVTFERVNSDGGTAFIDEVHLSSEEAFYGGPEAPNFPAGGAALGQNPATGYYRTAQAECEMSWNWGLVPCTYEGGWAVQGDFDHYSMLAWDDLRYGSPKTNAKLTKQALRNAFNIWCEKGGYSYAYFYPVQKSIAQMDAPLLVCIQEMNDRLSAPPKMGTMLPGVLTPEVAHCQGGVSDRYYRSWSKQKRPAELPEHSWKSWLVTSPATADYRISLEASGGPAELRVDDAVVARGGAGQGLTATVRLTAGVHAVKVKSLDKPLKVVKLSVDK
jgi:hypothetical protein